MKKQILFNAINAAIGVVIMVRTDVIITYVIALLSVILSIVNIILNYKRKENNNNNMEKQFALNDTISACGLLIMIWTDSIVMYILALLLVIYANVNVIRIYRKIRMEREQDA